MVILRGWRNISKFLFKILLKEDVGNIYYFQLCLWTNGFLKVAFCGHAQFQSDIGLEKETNFVKQLTSQNEVSRV